MRLENAPEVTAATHEMCMTMSPQKSPDVNGLIRVAYVVHTFDTGGIERCVAHLANHLDGARFWPMVICLSRSGAAAQWIAKDDLPIVALHKKPSNDLRAIARLGRTLRKHRVEVVHSHNWGTLIETAVARRWAGVSCHVHTEHGQGLHEGLGTMKRLLRRWATRWAFNRADAVLVCAESVRPLLHSRSGFPESQIQFIPNGVEDPLATRTATDPGELRRTLRLPAESLVVGSLARLVPVKDFGAAIEAIGILSRRAHDVHLVLVGDGPEHDRLAARAEAAGISDRVHLVGQQDNVGDWLRAFDVYLNSSLSEAMNLGILEAMAAGVPVVATDVGDNAAIVGGIGERRDGADGEASACGLLVPPGNPRELGRALERLIGDHSLRYEFGRRSSDRFAASYTIDRMVASHEDLYEKLTGVRNAV